VDDFFNFEVINSKRESMAFDSIAFTRHGSITEDKKNMANIQQKQ
jgi:hypothetical protein